MATLKRKTNNGYEPLPAMVVRKTNAENGSGIGTCSTSSGTALIVSLTDYELVANGFVAVTFEHDVPAGATLNVNSKGAKPIIYKGSAIEADVIKADDTVTFCYDGTNYVITSLGGESGSGSSAGLEIVAASGTTLNAEVGKYYRYDSDVSNLTVNLPTITGVTEVQVIKLYFNTTDSPNILFTSSNDIIYSKDFKIEDYTLSEYTIINNGSAWVLSRKIISSRLLLRLGKTLTDESSYNWTTTTSGTVTPNYNNEGILIGGNSSYLSLDAGIKDILLNKDFIISIDVKLISYNNSDITFISMGGSNTSGGVLSFEANSSGINEVAYYAGSYKIRQSFSGSYGIWYKIQFKKLNGLSSILINGNIIGVSDYTFSNASNFIIGANQSSLSQCINGIVKNLEIKILQ